MKKIWILIHVYHGLIQEPEIFFSKSIAVKRKKKILKNFNRDYDELDIFEKVVK